MSQDHVYTWYPSLREEGFGLVSAPGTFSAALSAGSEALSPDSSPAAVSAGLDGDEPAPPSQAVNVAADASTKVKIVRFIGRSYAISERTFPENGRRSVQNRSSSRISQKPRSPEHMPAGLARSLSQVSVPRLKVPRLPEFADD